MQMTSFVGIDYSRASERKFIEAAKEGTNITGLGAMQATPFSSQDTVTQEKPTSLQNGIIVCFI